MSTSLTTLTLSASVVELRRARLVDLPAVVSLLAADELGQSRESVDLADLQAYRRAFDAIDADPSHLLVVATDGTEIVGTLQLTVIPGLSRRGALRAQVEAVRVKADRRSHGLGTAMLQWAVAEARDRGCTLVQLTTDKKRGDAHRFYNRRLRGISRGIQALPMTTGRPDCLNAVDGGR